MKSKSHYRNLNTGQRTSFGARFIIENPLRCFCTTRYCVQNCILYAISVVVTLVASLFISQVSNAETIFTFWHSSFSNAHSSSFFVDPSKGNDKAVNWCSKRITDFGWPPPAHCRLFWNQWFHTTVSTAKFSSRALLRTVWSFASSSNYKINTGHRTSPGELFSQLA